VISRASIKLVSKILAKVAMRKTVLDVNQRSAKSEALRRSLSDTSCSDPSLLISKKEIESKKPTTAKLDR
jgi:hypothetical protein